MVTSYYLETDRDTSLLSFSVGERCSWHTYLNGKSNYHKHILDAHNKSGQKPACVVVKQVADNTTSGSLNVLA